MINAADMAEMRAQMNETHDGTLVIRRRTMVSDGQGGQTPSYTPVTGGTVLYRSVQVTGLERAMSGRQGTATFWRLGLPLTPTVRASDRLYEGTVPVWEVVSANLPRSIALEQLVDVVRF
jgi:hypothetical protein